MPKTILLTQDSAADAKSLRAPLQDSAGESSRIEWVRCCREGLERLSGGLRKALRNMIGRAAKAAALFEEWERAQVTLDSIGDAVISTDAAGLVTYLNAVAERLTGWSRKDAVGRPLADVFRIINADSRETAMDPMQQAIREDRAVALAPNCILVRRDGMEAIVEDSAAPIHDREGKMTGAVIVFRDVTAAQVLSRKMSHLAQHDGLTDLPNRMLLDDRLAQAMAMVQRRGSKLAVLYVDIDRFKHVNDTSGHLVGDRLLQSISKRLLDCVRSSDTVSRQGGDEFIILLSEVSDAKDAAVTARKILAALGEPHSIDHHKLHVSASIGIVIYPEDGNSAEALIKNADVAMYQAKDCGRNNYQSFKAEMNWHAVERQAQENRLHHTLEQRELALDHQPRVNPHGEARSGRPGRRRVRQET